MTLEEAQAELARANAYHQRMCERYYAALGFGTFTEIEEAKKRVVSSLRTRDRAEGRVARLLARSLQQSQIAGPK